MKLSNKPNRLRQRGFVVELIIAILVIVIGGYVIFKLARLIKNINQHGTNNTTSVGYATNYGGFYAPLTTKWLPRVAGQSFSFQYCICPAGAVRILVNTTNEYKVMVNLTTNLLVMDFDLVHLTELDTTNAPVNAVIYKSTNMLDWSAISTNYAVDVGAVYQFTDYNYSYPKAFYWVQPKSIYEHVAENTNAG